jgi:signal transduction histidine kinase/DNA-binding response OmpR family regulator/streptogramin lyase
MTFHIVHAQNVMYSSNISSPLINAFAEDRNGNIWMGTNYGLNVFNGATYNTFYATNEVGGLDNDDIRTMLFDRQGRLWLGNESGISVMENKTFRNITASGFSVIYGICEIDSSSIIISNRYGLTKVNKNTLVAENLLKLDQPILIYKMIVSEGLNSIWFAPDNTSVIYLTDSQLSYIEELELPETIQICNMVCDIHKHVWISAMNGSLYCYDMKSRKLLDIPQSLLTFHKSGTPLFCCSNEEGIILIGIQDKGMICFNPENLQITQVFPEEKLHEDAYTAFMDSKRNVWLSDKINNYKFYSASRTFTTLSSMLSVMSDKDIRNIYIDQWEHLWIRGRNDLLCCDKQTGDILYHAKGIYGHLFIDSSNRLWTSEERNTIRCYAISASGSLQQIFQHSFSTRAFSIGEDKKGTIWISLTDGFACISPTMGINYKYAPKGLTPSLLHTQMPEKETYIYMNNSELFMLDNEAQFVQINLPVNNPVCALTDQNNNLWIGSISEGLVLYDSSQQEIKRYTHVSDGLLEPSIKSMTKDLNGNIWISTSAFIAHFDDKTNAFSYISDPAFSNGKLYNKNCTTIDQEGKLYFGGSGGITVVDPSIVVPQEKRKRDIILESVSVNGETIHSKNWKDMELAYHLNSLEFIFSSTDYENGKALQYQYRLDNYDSQWHLTNTTPPTAIYTQLPAGDYEMQVCVRRLGGQWSDPKTLLNFSIKPAPWLTWWAKLIYLFLLLALLAAILRFIIKWRLKNEKLALAQRGEELRQNHINLLTNLSHEYRTPLTLIYAPLMQLLHSVGLNEHDKQLLQLMKKNAEHMKQLTEQMLNVNDLTGNGVPDEKLQVCPVNLQEQLGICIDNFRYIAHENHVNITYLTPDVPVTAVFADMDKIRKITNNLLSNAIKYARQADETEETSVKVSLGFSGEDNVVIQVEDNGPGIAKEMEEELFTRFKRFSDNQTIEGSGIGLHYSMHLANLHKGKLTYQHAQPHGSIFLLEIPVSEAAYTPEEIQKEALVQGSISTSDDVADQSKKPKEYHVLVVEDNEDVRHYLTRLFQDQYNVITASDGQEALDLLKLQIPDLIVSDIVMPRMDGYKLCAIMKQDEQWGHLPIILLTAKNDVRSSIQGLSYGADSYVAKPFDPSYLLAVASNLIMNRRRLQKFILNMTSTSQEENAEEATSSLSESERQLLEAIHHQMDLHLGEEGFSAKNLAENVNMSYSSLYARIKSLTGQTPQNYIIAYRMNRAMELLKKHEQPVTAICYEVGFSSVQYFSTSFKKYFGKSPSEV